MTQNFPRIRIICCFGILQGQKIQRKTKNQGVIENWKIPVLEVPNLCYISRWDFSFTVHHTCVSWSLSLSWTSLLTSLFFSSESSGVVLMRSLQASIACRSSSEVDTPMKDYGKYITGSGTSETKFKCVNSGVYAKEFCKFIQTKNHK